MNTYFTKLENKLKKSSYLYNLLRIKKKTMNTQVESRYIIK